MKTSKLYILLLSTLAFASCTKEMTEGLDEVNVSVVTSETVTAEGSIITVKKGTPVEFSFAGEPDFITFYSGELGHQYIYRQRVENEGFYIHSTGSAYSWKTAWLVSDPIKITSCEPDQGVSIKNLSQDIRSYSYTYENVGTYRATFLITNANYKHDDSQVYTVVVNVTD